MVPYTLALNAIQPSGGRVLYFEGKGIYTVIYSVRIDCSVTTQLLLIASTLIAHTTHLLTLSTHTLARAPHIFAHAITVTWCRATFFYSCRCVASPTSTHESTCTCSEVLILGETVLDASAYDAPDPSRVATGDLVLELGDEAVVESFVTRYCILKARAFITP